MSNYESKYEDVFHKPKGTGGATEWEDILIKKGIIEDPHKKEKEIADELEKMTEAARAAYDPYENKTLDQLDELEDDVDEAILDKYRQQRLAQLKAEAVRSRFGEVREITKSDFIDEVNKAGDGVNVVVLLYQDPIPESRLMEQTLRRLAAKKRATKFLRIQATNCIENYPDTHVPTLLLYRSGECLATLVGLAPFGGLGMTIADLEWGLAERGVVETEMEQAPVKRALTKHEKTNRIAHASSDEDEDY
jgi:hypothetical protein